MTEQELDALVEHLRDHANKIPALWPDKAATAITTLRAQLADARAEIARLTDLNSTAYIDGHDAAKNEYRDEIQRLETLNAQLTVMVGDDAVEQIEAALAAQIERDAGICHALYRMALKDSDDDLSSPWKSHKASAYGTALQAILNQPHDRSALDAAIRAAKVEAWKEAAAWHEREAAGAMNSLHCGSENSEYRAANRLHDFHKASAAAFLALIGEGV